MRAKPLVLGRRLPRRVTARRTTPGVEGAVPDASSPLSLPLDRFRPSVPIARLSLLVCEALDHGKYPPPAAGSMLRIGGGDPALGDAMELYPLLLALLEFFLLFLAFLLCNRVRLIVFIKLCAAGDEAVPPPHGPVAVVKEGAKGVGALGFESL